MGGSANAQAGSIDNANINFFIFFPFLLLFDQYFFGLHKRYCINRNSYLLNLTFKSSRFLYRNSLLCAKFYNSYMRAAIVWWWFAGFSLVPLKLSFTTSHTKSATGRDSSISVIKTGIFQSLNHL